MSIKLKKFILFSGDVIILFLALYLTLLIRYGSNFSFEIWKLHLFPFAIIYAFWIIVFYINNLYSLSEARISFYFYQKLISTLIICGTIAIAFFYFNTGINIAPKTNLFLNLIITAILFAFWRNLFNFIAKSTTKNNVIVIGYSDLAYHFSCKLNNTPQLGFKIAAFVLPENSEMKTMSDIEFIPLSENLQDFILKNNVNTVIINSEDDKGIIKRLFQYLPLGLNFISFVGFYESLFLRVPLDAVDQVWFIENLTEGSKKHFDTIKRLIDILISLILGIISLPLIPFIIIIIKATSEGPIFFKQIRVGKNGKNFLAIKFRSMVTGAESNGPQWAIKNDPRITRIGNFLRKTRLDEIPQLINILKGEMSLVGPRPERPEFIEILEKNINFYKQRLLVKPGLTGWAQINFPYGSSINDAMQKLQYDLYYIKHRSLSFDLKIILKTIAIVLSFKGQ